MSDLHKSDPSSPYADDLEFVRDYARRNDGYQLVQPVVDFINAHPAPQIIRTVEELEALEPEAIVQRYPQHPGQYSYPETASDLAYVVQRWGTDQHLPAVVITPADQVRAARKALEEA